MWCSSGLGGYGNSAFEPNEFAVHGDKRGLLLTGGLTPLTITEATGLATAQPQQRRVSTTYVAAAPSAQVLSYIVSRVLARLVTKKLLRAQDFAVRYTMEHKRDLLLMGRLTPLVITEATRLVTAQEQQRRVSTTYFAAVPSG